MIRISIIIILFLISTVPNLVAAPIADSHLLQEDLAIELVQSLGWSFGLPDEPEPEDYLAILNGRRTYRFEIEEVVVPDADAPLAPKETLTFGTFSGRNWQRAPGREITPQVEFLLPITGRYTIKASLFKPGFTFRIDGQTLTADGESKFSDVPFGTIDLAAGRWTAEMTIPSRGGIDYLLLEAPPARRVAPLSGWQLDKPLANRDLAVTSLQALELEGLLPMRPETIEIEAEAAPTPSGAVCCADLYKGPVKGEWVRSDSGETVYSHLFEIDRPGIYDLYLNLQGKSNFEGILNDRDHFAITPKPFFTKMLAGSFQLEKGVNQIVIKIPLRGGLDRFSFQARRSDPTDYLRLSGLVDAETTPDEFNNYLRLVAAIGAER